MQRRPFLGPQSLGEALRLLRSRAQCTRNELSALAGLSSGALSSYESDASVPSAAALRRLTSVIADRLGCDVPELWESFGQLLDDPPDRAAPQPSASSGRSPRR